MKIKGLDFVKTCSVCPEQYDVFNGKGKQVGYVRLRWGELTCEYPDVGGEYIYTTAIGDGYTGEFENQEQREHHLNAIADKIIKKMGAVFNLSS